MEKIMQVSSDEFWIQWSEGWAQGLPPSSPCLLLWHNSHFLLPCTVCLGDIKLLAALPIPYTFITSVPLAQLSVLCLECPWFAPSFLSITWLSLCTLRLSSWATTLRSSLPFGSPFLGWNSPSFCSLNIPLSLYHLHCKIIISVSTLPSCPWISEILVNVFFTINSPNPCALLVGLQIGAASIENSMEVPKP